MQSVHFGAGNIGRGFIGQLLHEAGYDITFVDIQADLVDALKREGRYEVILADEAEERIVVDRVTALHSVNEAAVDRIVPEQTTEGVDVLVEPFFEWIVDASQIKGDRPDVPGITYVEDLGP